MMFFLVLTLVFIHFASCSPTAQPDCKVIQGDSAWPAQDVWTEAMPRVMQLLSTGPAKHPNYQLAAENIQDVIAAVNFAREHNIRLTILNSGHDFLGRNEAPSGLSLIVSDLKGVRVSSSFTPSADGAGSTNSSTVPQDPSGQMYVTFGAGWSTQALNTELAKSNLFTIGAAHGTVSVAGGFSQTAGHSIMAPKYGLGADQVMEYKVVTADGVLRVANSVSNPDLFWALRGGGGGTFGVVVEATVKAYPSPRIGVSLAFINTTDPSDRTSIIPAMAWLHSQLPRYTDMGLGAYYFVYPNGLEFFAINSGSEGSNTWMDKNWTPVLQKVASFPGMSKSMTYGSLTLPNFKIFFDMLSGGGRTGGFSLLGKRDEADYEVIRDFVRRHGPEEHDSEMGGTVSALGIQKMDSWFLGSDHLQSPQFERVLQDTMADLNDGELRGQLTCGGKVHQLGNDTSVNPAWRKTYVHMIIKRHDDVWPDARALRKFAPEMGAYANEASPRMPAWKQSFWGANYDRLSEIKKKYDPGQLFWVTPGIDADHWQVKDGRLCRSQPQSGNAVGADAIAPQNDNTNVADAEMDMDWAGMQFPFSQKSDWGLPLLFSLGMR